MADVTYARTSKLTFEMPKAYGPTIIRAIIHYVDSDGQEVIFSSGTQHELFRKLEDVFQEEVKFTCPVSGQEYAATVGAIAEAISNIVVAWMPEEFPGRLDEEGRYIVKGEE